MGPKPFEVEIIFLSSTYDLNSYCFYFYTLTKYESFFFPEMKLYDNCKNTNETRFLIKTDLQSY